ncbi:CAP domain-containing protein, partial [Candidatus Fermentibacterales bacterium]|nr:CAP domain-containing protein [Candidatus Fermentibacterales bacterium]
MLRTVVPALLVPLLCPGCCLLSTPRTGTVDHELEMFVFGAVNCHRAQMGLETLEWSESVAMVCRGHCRDMSSGAREIGHGGMDFRVLMVELMLNVTSYRENVSAVQGGEHPASCAYATWLDSRTHRRNIEGEAT